MLSKKKEKKSITKNIGFYMVKQLSGILLPMIVYPYVLRKLGADSLGKVEYAKSVVSYFVLLSGLGIADYAIREGAQIRDEKEKFNQFATQIFFFHVITSVIALLCGFAFTFTEAFREYGHLMWCFLLVIPFSVCGRNWIFGIYEEYQYISVRTVCFQILSAVFTFLLVKGEQDYFWYAVILALSSAAPNLINLKKIPDYMQFDFRKFNIKPHIKPILLIFAMAFASNIYMTMDVSMLGFLAGTKYVGLYSGANKLIIVIGTCIAAIRTVLLPRLSYLMGQKDQESFQKLNSTTLQFMVMLAIPTAFGIACLRKEIILLFCGEGFMPAVKTLGILTPEIVLSVLSGYIVYQILMPLKKEKQACICIVAGACTNLLCNSFMIPLWKQNGAAAATCIAEIVVLVSAFSCAYGDIRKHLDMRNIGREFFRYTISGVGMFLICSMVSRAVDGTLQTLIAVVAAGVVSYFTIYMVSR